MKKIKIFFFIFRAQFQFNFGNNFNSRNNSSTSTMLPKIIEIAQEMTELSQFLNLVSRLSEQTLITVMKFKIVSNHCGTFNKRNLSYVTVIMFRILIAN